MEVRDLIPLQASATSRVQVVRWIMFPSCTSGIPNILIMGTAMLVAKVFIGNVMIPIKLSGTGTMKNINNIGKSIIFIRLKPKQYQASDIRESMSISRGTRSILPTKNRIYIHRLTIKINNPKELVQKPHFRLPMLSIYDFKSCLF
jgi:hypothetical protein